MQLLFLQEEAAFRCWLGLLRNGNINKNSITSNKNKQKPSTNSLTSNYHLGPLCGEGVPETYLCASEYICAYVLFPFLSLKNTVTLIFKNLKYTFNNDNIHTSNAFVMW